jgi:hypothetical protein
MRSMHIRRSKYRQRQLDPVNAPVITIEQQIAAVVRELRLRRQMYPLWIQGGRLTQQKADYEIAAMEAVLETVRAAMPPDLLSEKA